ACRANGGAGAAPACEEGRPGTGREIRGEESGNEGCGEEGCDEEGGSEKNGGEEGGHQEESREKGRQRRRRPASGGLIDVWTTQHRDRARGRGGDARPAAARRGPEDPA